jgi:hypothetical protein
MSKPRKQLKGQPTTDARGNATWKWSGDATVNTAQVEELADGLSLEPPATSSQFLDPYNQPHSQPQEAAKRRGLDDMRRLDAEMKAEHEKFVRELRQRLPRKPGKS